MAGDKWLTQGQVSFHSNLHLTLNQLEHIKAPSFNLTWETLKAITCAMSQRRLSCHCIAAQLYFLSNPVASPSLSTGVVPKNIPNESPALISISETTWGTQPATANDWDKLGRHMNQFGQ